MKDGVETPKRLVNLKGVGGLTGVRAEKDGGLRIGALTTLDDLAADAALGFEHPAWPPPPAAWPGRRSATSPPSAATSASGPAAGTSATASASSPMRDGKSMVTEGDNRYHAILGNDGPAYFVQPSTLAPLLIALGAQVTLFGPEGERRHGAGEALPHPPGGGRAGARPAPGEILTEVLLPPAAGRRIASYEVRQRETLDWSLATASVALEMERSGKVAGPGSVLGQVAPIPWVPPRPRSSCKGKTIDAELAAKAGEAAVHKARALSRNRYKIQLARVAVKRALVAAAGIMEAED